MLGAAQAELAAVRGDHLELQLGEALGAWASYVRYEAAALTFGPWRSPPATSSPPPGP